MLEAFLAFARSDALDAPTRTDPIELARDIVRQSERAYPVSIGQLQGEGTEMLRPVALRRAIENLVMNAVRYGNEARLSASITENAISFVVEDSGPGIPPDKRQYVLKPFSRLDAARNQNTGSGVGLGLTIASDIARRHGGSLIIGVSRDLGGARIELLVPR
jgi:two-component system osmolarity sensor histidine kinase EnvZ